jgi:hypothetical protein
MTSKDIAGINNRRLNVQVVSKTSEQAAEHFGWIPHFPALTSSTRDLALQLPLGVLSFTAPPNFGVSVILPSRHPQR